MKRLIIRLSHMIIVLSLLASCNNVSKRADQEQGDGQKFKNWANDTLGCKGGRTFNEANKIIAYLKTQNNKREISLIKLLGKPNYQYNDGQAVTFRYYLNHPYDTNNDYDLSYLEIRQYKSLYSTSLIS